MDEQSPEDWETEGGGRSLGFKIVAGVVSALGIGAVWLVASGLFLIEDKPEIGAGPPVDEKTLEIDGDEAVGQALRVWEAWLESPGLAGRLALVRDPERVEPLMRDFHEVRGHPFPTMSECRAGHPVTQDGRRMVFLEIEDYAGRRYPVALFHGDEGWRVDWESLSAYGTMDWIEWIERKPEEAQRLRVFARELEQRWWPPGVGKEWRFVQLEHRDSTETVVIAVRGGVAADLARKVEGKRVPLTIEARWNPEIDYFELLRVVADGWSL